MNDIFLNNCKNIYLFSVFYVEKKNNGTTDKKINKKLNTSANEKRKKERKNLYLYYYIY